MPIKHDLYEKLCEIIDKFGDKNWYCWTDIVNYLENIPSIAFTKPDNIEFLLFKSTKESLISIGIVDDTVFPLL